MDLLYFERNTVSGDSNISFLVLNKYGCHIDCDGCLEPNRIDRCLRCKPTMRLVGGICTLKTIPCPATTKENALGEC
jgi:hypothetical protein